MISIQSESGGRYCKTVALCVFAIAFSFSSPAQAFVAAKVPGPDVVRSDAPVSRVLFGLGGGLGRGFGRGFGKRLGGFGRGLGRGFRKSFGGFGGPGAFRPIGPGGRGFRPKRLPKGIDRPFRPGRPIMRPPRPGRPAGFRPIRRPGRPGYWRHKHRPRFFGRFFGGVMLGTAIGVAIAGTAPYPPHPDLCWYWSDARKKYGYWYYCAEPEN